MVTLFCAVVGEKGSAFSIEIDANDSVGDLMDAIALKEKYEFAASKLKLFVAKTSQNKWLSSFSDEVKNLREGLTTVSIKSLMHEDNKIFGVEDVLTGMTIPKNKAIHVLVAPPEK